MRAEGWRRGWNTFVGVVFLAGVRSAALVGLLHGCFVGWLD